MSLLPHPHPTRDDQAHTLQVQRVRASLLLAPRAYDDARRA
jgi:hypothetical protein